MRGISGRVAANSIWLVLFAIGVTAGAFLSFATGVLFDDSYSLSVPMPEGGGILPGQEVTVLGRSVGTVEEVELAEQGVMLDLKIDGKYQVPTTAEVKVLRRSPIGEQAIDFKPTKVPWTPAEQGSTIIPESAVVPASVPNLLREADRLFTAVDPDDLGGLVHELSLALRNRGPVLKKLGRDSLDLQTVLVGGIPQFQRLIDSSEPVLQVLNDHKAALASSFTNAADLSDTLLAVRPVTERLLDTAPPALNEVSTLVQNERANISCVFDDVIALNGMLTGPSTANGAPAALYGNKLDEVEAALQLNRGFFQGFDIITQYDPDTGAPWNRVYFPLAEPGGQAYPSLRATPSTKPGAACQTTSFGLGVQAVRQDNASPVIGGSPGIDFAPIVEGAGPVRQGAPAGTTGEGGDGAGAGTDGQGGQGGQGTTNAAGSGAGETGVNRRLPLPRTGGGLTLLAPLLLGGALLLHRRRRR